ncbi:MAG: methionyl-tRNA formyltransferase [Alphaproteobacteria bacterium]|nr:methionyl-tRNA formyltransferase [Alphaproteobacteria bacterium]
MTDNRLRIIFMGTPDFAVGSLTSLYQSRHNIIAVYSQPPRPKGRGQQMQPSPVQDYAVLHGIPVFHPASLKSAEEQTKFAALRADVAVVAAYGLLLPKAILQAPCYGCINIHASLLPRWRGASPIQRAIWEGDDESGITLMQMDEGLDTGPMIAQQSVPISARTTAQSLHDELATLGARMIVQQMDTLAQQKMLHSTPQDNALATHAPLLKKEDGLIDWAQPAPQIDRQIRALNPWPGTWAEIGVKRFKILEAQIALEPGTGTWACGQNTYLKILRLQPEGKAPMNFTDAVNGGYIKIA